MQHVIKKILFTSFLVPVALCAKSFEEAYVESHAGRTDMPVPIAVVRPIVPPGHEGERVWLSFLVEADGVPREIAAPIEADRTLVKQLATAVAQWRFKPLVRNGVVVRTRVTLPFVIDANLDVGQVAAR